jgi:hypothetical protein
MRRLLPVAAALAALALLPASAAAKELAKVQVCGAGGACAPVRGGAQARMTATSAGMKSPAPRRAGWYEVRGIMRVPGLAKSEQPPPLTFQWVPSASVVRVMGEADFEWRSVAPVATHVLRRAARGVPPHPASTMPGPVAGTGPPPSPVRDGDGTPWGWLAAAAAALAAATLASARRLTRRPASP